MNDQPHRPRRGPRPLSPAENRRYTLTPGDREELRGEVVALYDAGRSLRRIATDTGYSYGLVRRLLLEAGVSLRPRGGPHPRNPPP